MRPDAVELLDEATRLLYPYDDLSGFFEKAPVAKNFPAESTEFVTAAQFIQIYDAWRGA